MFSFLTDCMNKMSTVRVCNFGIKVYNIHSYLIVIPGSIWTLMIYVCVVFLYVFFVSVLFFVIVGQYAL